MMRRRNTFASIFRNMMSCWRAFPVSHFLWRAFPRKMRWAAPTALPARLRGRLFFDVVRIIDARRPALFVLENVKNLKSHDQGNTFRIIMQTLDELGYDVADAADNGPDDPKIIDGQHFLPQHRERIVLVGFRRDLNLKPILRYAISPAVIHRAVRRWQNCWSPSSKPNIS
ncbi:DNA-cytosine methyltransferase [Salmonella enterica subsp. enterica serovar Madelia]|nr:DNA-cytosine methyltransferase [Salmonella enterica subsp. enterica serovar Madelia]